MLALGQHLALTSTGRIDRVAPLISGLSGLVAPGGDSVPSLPLHSAGPPALDLGYDANAGWLVAADFGLLRIGEDAASGYTIQFSAVFDDPVLYAARLALAGKSAKIFAGLEFEIIYQQVSPTVGVWRARITLPTLMRNFNAGAVAVTLPDFAIGIYTNGDFEVDVGFPWNEDFSVSFTVQAQAGPLPVTGSGGFYFASSPRRPKARSRPAPAFRRRPWARSIRSSPSASAPSSGSASPSRWASCRPASR